MSETSGLYTVPNSKEVDALLKGDFGVDEVAPENSEVMEAGDRESEVMEVGDRELSIEENYRNRIRQLQVEHAQQLNQLGNLITELYLDFEYINRVTEVLIHFTASKSPEAVRTVASLINYQAAASLAQIQDHNETAHYPNVLIHRNERSTT